MATDTLLGDVRTSVPADTATTYAGQAHNRRRWVRELCEFLGFRSVSALPRYRSEVVTTASWLAQQFENLGLQHVRVLSIPKGGQPSVYADWLHEIGRPTLLLYGHFDVQPVDLDGKWGTPPFRATLVGENLVARGASDDKGQLFVHLKAIESYMATSGRLPLNVKIWLEGEEEINSPNLGSFLDRELDRLRADAVLVSDTEMPARGRPSIIYGLRGNLAFELEVRGPSHDLHSGRYGGAVHNPLQALCELIAGLHDRRGRIAIPGFYRRVRNVAAHERRELRSQGPANERLQHELGVPAGWGEAGYSLFERMTIRPALTVNGLAGGSVGTGSKAIIPDRATANLSIRLVPDQEPAEIAHLLRLHLAAAASRSVRVRAKVTGGSRPVLVPRRSPAMAAAARAVYRTWGVPPILTRSGGSISVVEQLHRRLGVPVILLGFGLPDDNIHAPNEKLSLPQFFAGVQTIIQFFAEYAA